MQTSKPLRMWDIITLVAVLILSTGLSVISLATLLWHTKILGHKVAQEKEQDDWVGETNLVCECGKTIAL